jgi:hypothetical protein
MVRSRPIADQLDNLTDTFSVDQECADHLFRSRSANLVAELMLSHAWANSAFPICYRALADAVPKHFGERNDTAPLWNHILCDDLSQDLRLVPYLTLRGLISNASGAMCRALDHIGIIAHIWKSPEKVEALSDRDSGEYMFAFCRESNPITAQELAEANISKRFASMKFGASATSIYSDLNRIDLRHTQPPRFFFGYVPKSTQVACRFVERTNPEDESFQRRVTILANGHRTICGELISLCAEYAVPTEELRDAADAFKMFGSPAGEPSPELQRSVTELLTKVVGEQPQREKSRPSETRTRQAR